MLELIILIFLMGLLQMLNLFVWNYKHFLETRWVKILRPQIFSSKNIREGMQSRWVHAESKYFYINDSWNSQLRRTQYGILKPINGNMQNLSVSSRNFSSRIILQSKFGIKIWVMTTWIYWCKINTFWTTNRGLENKLVISWINTRNSANSKNHSGSIQKPASFKAKKIKASGLFLQRKQKIGVDFWFVWVLKLIMLC